MNLRYSARSFLRSPGVTIVLLLSIAAGVGSNAAVYGFAHGLTAPRLRLALPPGVVSIFARESPGGELSYDDIAAIERSGAFAWVGAVRQTQGMLLAEGRSAIVSVAAVTPPVAQLFDFPLQEGAVVGHRLWQLELEGHSEIRGDTISVDGVNVRVSGIAPEPLEGVYAGRNVDVWMTLRDDALGEGERSSRSFWALGRLHPDVEPHEAEARIRAARPAAGEIAVVSYTGAMPDVAEGLSRVGTLLRLAAGAVLLIACANVASFLLGRAAVRAHEISLRVALGASRRDLIAQLLVDSALVALAGGAAGALLGMWTSDIVPAFFFERDARELMFSPDMRGTLIAAAACVALLVACGLAPLLETRHDRPATVLQREGAGPSPSGRRLRSSLVVAQVGASCVLAISAVLLVQGLHQALQTAVRHRMDSPIVATVFARPNYELSYFRHVEEAALSAPGIAGAVWTARLPGTPPAWQPMRIEPGNAPVRDVMMDVAVFSPEAIDQFVFPPVAGRMFGGRETRYSCRVAVVNEAAAAAVFGGDAVGRVVRDEAGERVEIIGVVATRKPGPGQDAPGPTLYYSAAQVGDRPDLTGPVRFGVSRANRSARAVLDATVVSSGYFDAMGFSVVSGRISEDDDKRSTCRAAVVNEEAAERYFKGDATGSAVIDGAGRRVEIIGVVRAAPLGAFGPAPHPAIYFPMSVDVPTAMSLILAARDAPPSLVDDVRARVEAVPGRGLFDPVVQTLDQHMSRTSLAPLRIATVLITASAAIAGALGILGLYGALNAAARHRRREVSLRVALGAQARHVLGQVFGQGLRLAGAGAALGVLGAFAAARLLARITPIDLGASGWLWVAAPLVLAAAVLLAGALPARRALKVDPLSIMRDV